MKMKGKLNILFILILINPVLAYADTTVFRPNDSIGAPENNRDSLYMTQTGEVREFSLSIPIINTEFDCVGAIAFRDVNISRFDSINQANLSLNFQLEYLSSSEPLMITIYGYASSLENGTFNEISTSIPLTAHHVAVDLQNVTSPGFYLVDITEVVCETVNKEYWESGDTLGIIIYSTSQSVARSYQSNYGINRPKLSIRYGEVDYSPDEEGEYVDSYKGYDIWKTNSTVIFYGLTGPNTWVKLPITLTVDAGAVQRRNATTWNSSYIPDGPYGEIFGNITYEGNYYDEFLEAGALTYNSINIGRCQGVLDSQRKVMVFGLERTYGSQVGSELPMGYVGCYGKSMSGSWGLKGVNNIPIVGTMLRSYDNDEITLEADVQLSSATSTPDTLKITEGKYYIMRYELNYGLSGYGGSLYLCHYRNTVFHLNETDGEVSNVGNVQLHFNWTLARYESLNRIELIECVGGGSAFDLVAQIYVSRGFIPSRSYENSIYIYKNGTLIDELPDLNDTEIQDWIDENLLGGGTTDDPSPGGWEDEGPFKRSSLRLYMFIIGWNCFWLPWFYVAQASGLRKIMSFWVALMISVIGLALLWAIPGI